MSLFAALEPKIDILVLGVGDKKDIDKVSEYGRILYEGGEGMRYLYIVREIALEPTAENPAFVIGILKQQIGIEAKIGLCMVDIRKLCYCLFTFP